MTGPSRWADKVGNDDATRGKDYAARFAALAAQGTDIHGEATLCASLVDSGARVLDAGCGTGRVAIRLAELGYDCVGVDMDASMLAVAQASSTAVTWHHRDLANLGDLGAAFDLIVAAGNVIPLLAAGTEATVLGGLAAALSDDGLLLTGFGLDAAHLPLDEAPFGVADYDAWCGAAGLTMLDRFSTWTRDPYVDGGGYAVTLSQRSN
jgi:SAM-dependent methyltransferase